MECKFCSKQTSNQAFCSNACQQAHRRAKLTADLIEGRYLGKLMGFKSGSWQRQVLIDIKGYRCRKCGINDYNDEPITLEVNHVDGDALNNTIENLEFLCPNCHSQTPNFRALNKSSSRSYRRKPV